MIEIEYVLNPIYANSVGNAINCMVKFSHLSDVVPFGATSYDPEEYGVQIFNSLLAGDFGPIAPYVPPVIPVVEII